MKIIIDERLAGKEILDILKCELDLSKNMIIELKKRPDGILLGGAHATVRARTALGDELTLALDERESSDNIIPVDLPLDILYEDSDIIVLNKPPYMPTHPSHNHYDDTLANALRFYFRDHPFVFRTVNRLDRNTSGIVLVAKNRHASRGLYRDMASGRIKKHYVALLSGKIDRENPDILWLSPSRGQIDIPIRRQTESIIFRETCTADAPGAARALTYFEILSENENFTKVLVSPKTGRTHQIRVHFAHIKNPLIGDELYASASDIVPRHALHAIKIEFYHPITNAPMIICTPMPPDLENAERKLMLRGNLKGDISETQG